MNEDSTQSALPRALSKPVVRAFEGVGLHSLESLTGAPASQLRALHGVGPKAIRTLDEVLESRGLPALTD